jgi:hypothetical protein
MRSLRVQRHAADSPRERESDGQLGVESTDALLALSLVLARHACAYREAAHAAHAATARVERLRGYGNAINPQQAAQFIEAAIECGVLTQPAEQVAA